MIFYSWLWVFNMFKLYYFYVHCFFFEYEQCVDKGLVQIYVSIPYMFPQATYCFSSLKYISSSIITNLYWQTL